MESSVSTIFLHIPTNKQLAWSKSKKSKISGIYLTIKSVRKHSQEVELWRQERYKMPTNAS